MKKFLKKFLGFTLTAALVFAVAGCSSKDQSNEPAGAESEAADGTQASGEAAGTGEKIVNVGVTDSLGGINPFVIDQTEINKYAVGLMFLPLMELDSEMNFQGMLADSVTTEDNINFVVHIDENAVWSDGTPVTAADVEYTVRRLASPVVNNTTLMLYAFEGVSDEGFVEEGAESVAGIQIIDEKTIQFTAKYPMAPVSYTHLRAHET